MADKRDFDPRQFYDYEKEAAGKTDAEVEAITRDIYRSILYGVAPDDRGRSPDLPRMPAEPDTPREPTSVWEKDSLPGMPEKPRPASRERVKPKKKGRSGQYIKTALCCLLLIAGLYGIAIYGNIPLIRKWRDIYIETAMGTMTHQWLATAFIPKDIINSVMQSRTDIETDQEAIDTTWDAAPLKGADKKTEWEKLRKGFFKLYSEIDEGSFEDYIAQKGESCIDSEGYLVIDETDLGADPTGIRTTAGDEVLAIDTKNGITIVRIQGPEYEGRLAIIKDPAQVGLELAPGFGEVGAVISKIAEEAGAVLAVNASGFYDPEGHGNGGMPHGLVIQEGKTYSNFAGGNNKTIGFDYDNNLQIGIYRDGADLRDAVEFKPALIFDGTQMVSGSAGWGVSPRTAIGQTENGQVLLLVVDGRQPGWSIGCTMGDLAEVLLRYDAYQACNLDGGSSSIMYYNGRRITKPSAGNKEDGRRLPNAFVVTAR